MTIETLTTPADIVTEALYAALGPIICDALADPVVQDVMVNPDGGIWVRRQGVMARRGDLDESSRRRALAYAAHLAGRTIRYDNPRTSAILPGTLARLKGHIPPAASGPSFSIRRPAPRLFDLQRDYIDTGVMTATQAEFLSSVAGLRNIMVSGPPGTGKSSLATALLALPAFATKRVVSIEEDAELGLPENSVRLLIELEASPPITAQVLVGDALRMFPQVLLIGEVRGGEALDLIMAWNTGLIGLSTVHANSAEDVLVRLGQQIELNEGVKASPGEIARAVHVVVHLAHTETGRTVEAVAGVRWCGDHAEFDYIQ